MLNIARGNEIASSVSGIALVGEMLRSCPSFSGIDRLRLPKTSRGHVSHGAAVACAVWWLRLLCVAYTVALVVRLEAPRRVVIRKLVCLYFKYIRKSEEA